MKKTAVNKVHELRYTYNIDMALCIFDFLICSVLCAGGSEYVNIAGVIALITAVIPIGFRRLYFKDEIIPKSVGAVMTVYRVLLGGLLLYGIDYFLVA
ncbi:hypothetical protein [Ruminococcus flavefaciens]|uniref:Uncharacterized protein n=1 Tax=Ruminococcus flavefaciens TaxID=1265 RepID=A0A1M7MK42_RUMFL|nr:hypothetical protein [Ruminococcus flavefaciens]SHM90800.1 hypothetical protein SAMN04487860_12310 [Ruminococcus flavefaciens]